MFENTEIALPSIGEQERLLEEILSIRNQQQELERKLQESESLFNQKVFG